MNGDLKIGDVDDSVVGRKYDDGSGRLSADGRAFVLAWLDTHGSGVGLLRVMWPVDFGRARAAGLTPTDLEQYGREATVRAAVTWEPSKAKFVTHLSWRLRQVVQTATDERWYVPLRTKLRVRPSVWSFDAPDHEYAAPEAAKAREGDEDRHDEASATVSALRAAVLASADGRRRWQVLSLRHGLGGSRPPLTLGDIAAEVGVSSERVRQLLKAARSAIRKEFPHLMVVPT